MKVTAPVSVFTPLPLRSERVGSATAPAPSSSATSAISAAAAAPAAAPPSPATGGTLAPARAALAALPDIDEAKVAFLRDALARGEIQFDAQRLAGLVQRFHGGHV